VIGRSWKTPLINLPLGQQFPPVVLHCSSGGAAEGLAVRAAVLKPKRRWAVLSPMMRSRTFVRGFNRAWRDSR
jgi:hypothetical protein